MTKAMVIVLLVILICSCTQEAAIMRFTDFASELHQKGHFPEIESSLSSDHYDISVCRDYLIGELNTLVKERREAEIPNIVCGLVQLGFKEDAVNSLYPIYDYNDSLSLKSVKVYHYAFLYDQVDEVYVNDALKTYERFLESAIGRDDKISVKKTMSSYLAFAKSFDQPLNQTLVAEFLAEYNPGQIQPQKLDLETVYDLSIAQLLNVVADESSIRKLLNDSWINGHYEISGVKCMQKAASHVSYLDILYGGNLMDSSRRKEMADYMISAIMPDGSIRDMAYSGSECSAGDSVQYWEHIFSLNHVLHQI